MRSRSWVGAALVLGFLAWGCGGSGSTASSGGGGSSSTSSGGGGQPSATPASTWKVTGTIQFPANESATGLKVVVTLDQNANSASSYAGPPVDVAANGAFSLPVDTTHLLKTDQAAIISLILFQDKNGNGVNEVGEPVRQLAAAPGSGVWCDTKSCSSGADFLRILEGTHGSGTDGSFSIDVTGWYYSKGCNSDACAQLITTADSDLPAVTLVYSYLNNSAIAPK